MKPQIAFLHHDIWPDPSQQFLLSYDLSRALDECEQKVKSSTAESDWLVAGL